MKSILNLVRKTPRKAERKRGVTLIEAVLFISIALGLIVGGIVFFQQASLAQRVQGAVRTISSIASETRALFQAQQSFDGASTATLIAAGAVPSSIINGTNLRNEWGGAITVDATSATAGTGTTNFTVTYTDIPVAACVRLSSYDNSGSGVVGSNIVQVRWRPFTTGGTGTWITSVTGTNPVAQGANNGITPAEATTACNSVGASSNTDVGITFSR